MLVTICENSGDGHRLNYVGYFERESAALGHGSRVVPSLARAALARGPLVLPMLEQRTMQNLLVMAVRALGGRRTLSLVFRAGDAVRHKGARFAAKRALLRMVRRLPRTGVISIVPVSVDPRLGGIVNGWIYDPELCDLAAAALDRPAAAATKALRDLAGGRLIVTTLGRQTEEKGFGYFCRVWAENAEVRARCLFVAAGTVPAALAAMAGAFAAAGGVLIDRRIDDDELLDLYAGSDWIWCCYAPSYDQASGIFGRAVQFEVPAVVRRGSYTATLAAGLDHPTAAIAWNDPGDAGTALACNPPAALRAGRGRRSDAMRAHNRDVLRRHLG